jgi:hypothetical protein
MLILKSLNERNKLRKCFKHSLNTRGTLLTALKSVILIDGFDFVRFRSSIPIGKVRVASRSINSLKTL